VFSGAGLISDDLRSNALQLYFSRPISRRDYLLGKASVLVFFLSLLTLIPGIVFILMKLLFAGNLNFLFRYPLLPLSIIAYSMLLTGFFVFYTLLLSAASKNRRYVTILIFGLFFFSNILHRIFTGIFHSEFFSLLSIPANLNQIAAVLFGRKPPYDVSWLLSAAVISAWCLLSALVLTRRVRGVEVVK
jgi:ABC-type transport system involved in multi-copper enzyme maturation permease subunit